MTTIILNTRRQRRRSRADPRLRLAVRLHDLLTNNTSASPLSCPASRVRETSSGLLRLLNCVATASERRWETALSKLVSRVPSAAAQLCEAVASLTGVARNGCRRPALSPSLDSLYSELLALEREFGEVEIDLREATLAVESEPIELEGQYLGPFRIELRLPQLKLANRGRQGRGRGAAWIPGQWRGRPLDSQAFACVALDPHPADCSEATTHPHVRDDQPCLGEATSVVTAALWEGRLCDAFLAVRAVLQTYNASSPFVALEEWTGTGCSDCGRIRQRDDLFTCAGCDTEICDDCSRSCDGCDQTYCLSCLERSIDSDLLCESCRGSCRQCHRTCAVSLLDSGDGLCSDCAESEESEENTDDETDPTTSTPTENDHEESSQDSADLAPAPSVTTAVAGSPAAA